MLDELLGRAELKERIATLEDERDSLRARLEAEQERRSEAARERQAAEERVNRLEDRIAELEGRIERESGASKTGRGSLSFRSVTALRGGRRDAVLDRLDSVRAPPEGALTAAVADDGLPDAIREAFGERAPLVARAAPCVAVRDDAGLVSAALVPSVAPEPFVEWGDRFALDRSWFAPTGRFALALVRADLFAMGEYDGEERTAFEGFESDVQGSHSKGGYSQGRFERRRDAQMDEHLEECREVLAGRSVDRLYLAGDEAAISELAEEVDAAATRTVDATGKPEEALDEAFREFWTTRLYLV